MKDRRRELRLSSREDDLIVEAAGIMDVSVSEFLLDRAVSDAEAVVSAHRTVTLDPDQYRRFLEVLDAPTSPPPDLVDQVRRSRPLKHRG
jgi:uncharacterized protein (DUF1778 family)